MFVFTHVLVFTIRPTNVYLCTTSTPQVVPESKHNAAHERPVVSLMELREEALGDHYLLTALLLGMGTGMRRHQLHPAPETNIRDRDLVQPYIQARQIFHTACESLPAPVLQWLRRSLQLGGTKTTVLDDTTALGLTTKFMTLERLFNHDAQQGERLSAPRPSADEFGILAFDNIGFMRLGRQLDVGYEQYTVELWIIVRQSIIQKLRIDKASTEKRKYTALGFFVFCPGADSFGILGGRSETSLGTACGLAANLGDCAWDSLPQPTVVLQVLKHIALGPAQEEEGNGGGAEERDVAGRGAADEAESAEDEERDMEEDAPKIDDRLRQQKGMLRNSGVVYTEVTKQDLNSTKTVKDVRAGDRD